MIAVLEQSDGHGIGFVAGKAPPPSRRSEQIKGRFEPHALEKETLVELLTAQKRRPFEAQGKQAAALQRRWHKSQRYKGKPKTHTQDRRVGHRGKIQKAKIELRKSEIGQGGNLRAAGRPAQQRRPQDAGVKPALQKQTQEPPPQSHPGRKQRASKNEGGAAGLRQARNDTFSYSARL